MADRDPGVGSYRPKTGQTENNSDNRNETKKPGETKKDFLTTKTTSQNTSQNIQHMTW